MLDRWNPFGEIARLQDELWGNREQDFFRPSVDIKENENNITILAELPGVDLNDIDVQVEKGVLTLKGKRELKQEEKKENFHRIERSYGSFTRSFSLPDHVDTDNIHADLKHGVLTLQLPKSRTEQSKKIEIKAS